MAWAEYYRQQVAFYGQTLGQAQAHSQVGSQGRTQTAQALCLLLGQTPAPGWRVGEPTGQRRPRAAQQAALSSAPSGSRQPSLPQRSGPGGREMGGQSPQDGAHLPSGPGPARSAVCLSFPRCE